MYETMAQYYDSQGMFRHNHSRMARYDILLSFYKDTIASKLPTEQKEESIQCFSESLLYDLYLRENLKNRPAWASDEKVHKNAFRMFYQAEAQEHFLLKGYESYDEKQIAKMTHLEVMHYHPDTLEKGVYTFLFDYQKRDVLTYAAKVQEVQLHLGEES